MTFETYDLSVFISCDKQKVASAWRKSGLQEEWFIARANYVAESGQARASDDLCQQGDHYWWEWFDRNVETGSVAKADENGMEFSFGEGVKVLVSWENVHDGTLVKLSQIHHIDDTEITQRTYFSTSQSWTFYLTNLKAFLEHGIDLREQAPTRNDHVNV